MATNTREAKLSRLADGRGWRLERADGIRATDGGYRMVDAATGTLVAAVWSNPEGYGLTLDEIERALTA